MSVAPLYCALFALFFLVLSVRTVRLRRRLRIAVGDSGNEVMLRAMRAHANFAEYVPLALLLILVAEMRGADPVLLHVVSLCLLVGRVSHAFGVTQVNENYRYRVTGMALTFTSLGACAMYLLYNYVR